MKQVIGLEVHIELATKTKLFCRCANRFDAKPNHLVCPVCMGLPGSMPYLNKGAVELALRAALALGCEISSVSFWHRKQYDYPDLPKGYQITQGGVPFATGGGLTLPDGSWIPLERIHLEEDAGKLTHRGAYSYGDDNRAGVPLIELVTKPVIDSAEMAGAFIETLARTMRWLEVSDCRMNEGSLRCDVNLSLKDENGLWGERCEIKNLNSVKFIKQAITFEADRQEALLANGQPVPRQTRRFDEKTGQTLPMRGKETTADYGFLPEPDLPPLCLNPALVQEVQAAMPLTLKAGTQRLADLGVAEEQIWVLGAYPVLCKWLLHLADQLPEAQQKAGLALVISWVLGPLFGALSQKKQREQLVPDAQLPLADLVLAVLEQKLPGQKAGSLFVQALCGNSQPLQAWATGPRDFCVDLEALCRQAIEQLPQAVADVQSGKQKAMAALVGKVMGLSKGMADPKEAAKRLGQMIG